MGVKWREMFKKSNNFPDGGIPSTSRPENTAGQLEASFGGHFGGAPFIWYKEGPGTSCRNAYRPLPFVPELDQNDRAVCREMESLHIFMGCCEMLRSEYMLE